MSRTERNQKFNLFRSSFRQKFESLLENNKRVQELKNVYSLTILNHTPLGILDHTGVIAYFGNRTYETIIRDQTQTNLMEEGASFSIEKRDDGFVTIKLFPAKAENYQQKEAFIILNKKLDPKHLTKPLTVKKYWYYLIAYMEVTSLDGAPSYFQNLVVNYLRHFKPLIVNKKYNRSKIQDYFLNLLKFILTVGLSGFLILIINYFLNKDQENEIRQFRTDFNEKINTTQELEKGQNLYLKELKETFDSTINSTNQKIKQNFRNDSLLLEQIKKVAKNTAGNNE